MAERQLIPPQQINEARKDSAAIEDGLAFIESHRAARRRKNLARTALSIILVEPAGQQSDAG
jgi:hypothetical protein